MDWEVIDLYMEWVIEVWEPMHDSYERLALECSLGIHCGSDRNI